MTRYPRQRVEFALTERNLQGTRLYRRHHVDPLGVVASPSRFCDGTSFAVLYGATDFDTAFIEVIVRDRFVRQPERRILYSELQTRHWASFAAQLPLNLIDLTSNGAVKLGAPTDAAKSRNHCAGLALARSIYDDHLDVDGFLYASRLTGMECFAIFDRAVGKLKKESEGDVTTHPFLPSVLKMYDISLVRATRTF